MAFKALKDAGFVPPEIEAMKQLAALRALIADNPDAPDADALRQQLASTAADSDVAAANALRQRISELQQHLALRLEKLRASGSL